MERNGFTLMELMIAIAIVAILAAIALPSYRDYVERSYLSEAFSNLSGYQLQMQQFYQDSGSYANGGNCGVATPNTTHFSYVCAVANGGFTITATSRAVDGLTTGKYVFTIDDANNQTTTAFPGVNTAQSCWLTKIGATCS